MYGLPSFGEIQIYITVDAQGGKLLTRCYIRPLYVTLYFFVVHIFTAVQTSLSPVTRDPRVVNISTYF